MPLKLKGCLRQECDGLTFFDTTRPYSPGNTGGYGPENNVEGPLDFDTYVLRVWPPGANPQNDPPAAEIDLKDPPPEGPDDQGHYQWTITLQMLGLTVIQDGVWYAEVVGTKDDVQYLMDPLMPIFTRGYHEQLKLKLMSYDPSCGCQQGCEDPLELWMMLRGATCGAFCSIEQTKRVLAYLDKKLPLCC